MVWSSYGLASLWAGHVLWGRHVMSWTWGGLGTGCAWLRAGLFMGWAWIVPCMGFLMLRMGCSLHGMGSRVLFMI
jgi:hypothetical protein